MRKITQASLVVLAISLFTVGVITAQRLLGAKGVAIANISNQDKNHEILLRVEKAEEQEILLDGNGNAPLFIQEATVKEISAEDFSKLTGKVADVLRVFSLPQVKLLNTSGKVITEFSVMVRNEKTQFCKIFTYRDRNLSPGHTFQILREDLDKLETVTTTSLDGKTVAKKLKRGWASESLWINSDLQDFYLAVGYVKYDDGTKWLIN